MNSVADIPSDSTATVGATRPEPTFIPVHSSPPAPSSDVAVRHQTLLQATESLGDLDTAVSTLAVSLLSPVERGHGVLAILRRIVHAESGSFNISAGLGRFLERMWSGPFIESLIRSVHSRAVMLAEGRVGEGLDPSALMHDLRALVEWYSLRRLSVQACRREGFVEADPDSVFNLHIAHDVHRWGVDGMVVSCGLRFIARAHETVWFKVSARREREYVGARPAWSAWRDETDTVSAQDIGRQHRFAAIAPVRPRRQRCLIDRVEVFVPYAALDLPAGRHALELEAGISTQSGELVVSASTAETVQIRGSVDTVVVVPAPQALGVWGSDPVIGHEVLVNGSHVRFEGEPGWEELVLETRVDLTLIGLAGERLELEARLRRSDGTAVDMLDRPSGGGLEPYLARVALLPQQVVSKLPGVRITIPLADLDLPPGQHGLFVETVVVTRDGRIVCGAFERVAFEVAARGTVERIRSEPLEPTVVSDAEIDVGAILVAPNTRNDQVMLDVGVAVSARDWESSHYRLLVWLECRDGTPIRNIGGAERPVRRTIWFGGERRTPGDEGIVRVSFDAREFARFLKTRGPAERDIVTRVSVANEAGRTVFETFRVVAGDFAADVRAAMPPERSNVPVQPVDLTLEGDGFGEGEWKLRLTLNVNRFAHQSNRCTVYYEFVDQNGEPQRGSTSSGELSGDVAAITFPFIGRSGERRWYQTTVEVPCPLAAVVGPNAAGINVTLFSPRGEFWETAYYPLSNDRCRGASPLRSRFMSRATEERDDNAGVSGSPAGVLAKIRSALIG